MSTPNVPRRLQYEAWGNASRSEFWCGRVEWRTPSIMTDADGQPMSLLTTFEAGTHAEAMQNYYDFQGWGHYEPQPWDDDV